MAKMVTKTQKEVLAEKAVAASLALAPKAAKTSKNPYNLGALGREVASVGSPMNAQIQKQVTRGTSLNANPKHGLALMQISDELASRIAHASSGSRDATTANLEESHMHLDNANQSIRAHQEAHGAGDAAGAVFHLGEAGQHLATAANSLPMGQKEILKDDWKPQNTSWKVPAEENAQENLEHVSLEGLHKKINDVVQNYHKSVSEGTNAPVPETVRPTTDAPIGPLHQSYRSLESTRLQSHRLDQGATAFQGDRYSRNEQQLRDADSDARDDRRFRAQQSEKTPKANLGDHFDVGTAGGRA